MKITSALLLTLALVAPMVLAQSTNPVTVALTQFRVTKVTVDGKTVERFQAADTAAPGDVIEYRLVLENSSKDTVNGAAATLPIPAPTFYLDKTAVSPATTTLLASVDGKNFKLPPLKRNVMRDGKTVEEVIPANEYRAVRWRLQGKLDAGAKFEFKARVQVR
jgi:uncharacterized repeat protein (TIGR01451 family)